MKKRDKVKNVYAKKPKIYVHKPMRLTEIDATSKRTRGNEMPEVAPQHTGHTKVEMPGKKKHKAGKMKKVMKEFKAHKLHSGSKKGPIVKKRKQAIAIGISEMKKGKK